MTPKPSAREALAELIAAWDTFNGKSIPESLYAAISNARAALATAPAEPPELEPDHPILKRAQELRIALIACVAVTKAWHGKDAWDIYYNHSPEMKLIRDVLGPCPVPQPNER